MGRGKGLPVEGDGWGRASRGEPGRASAGRKEAGSRD